MKYDVFHKCGHCYIDFIKLYLLRSDHFEVAKGCQVGSSQPWIPWAPKLRADYDTLLQGGPCKIVINGVVAPINGLIHGYQGWYNTVTPTSGVVGPYLYPLVTSSNGGFPLLCYFTRGSLTVTVFRGPPCLWFSQNVFAAPGLRSLASDRRQ